MISLRGEKGWRILALQPCAKRDFTELMTETTTLGADLRRERERRGLALRTISESTKLSVALLEGLEADDISRWPGGIFRRAFVHAYAQCVGLDADEVFRRFERQFPVEGAEAADPAAAFASAAVRPTVVRPFPQPPVRPSAHRSSSLTPLLDDGSTSGA